MLIITLLACTACTSGLTQGDRSSDDSHGFTILSAQIIDRIDEIVPPEEKAFLVVKYEIENLRDQDDSYREWADQMKVEANEEFYDHTFIETLDGQMWATSLLKNEKKAGYIAFTVPEGISDFKLLFTFPISETEVVYDFRPADKRISVNVEYVATRLEQIERTKRIAVIGGLLSTFSNSPIRYLGIILVPREDIPELLEQTKGLPQDAKNKVIEDYLIENGHCTLE
jgi:hypothetical protein